MISSPFEAIPHSMWWAAATVNMVGYGEIYPVTDFGRLLAAFCGLIGIITMAFPVIVVGVNFTHAIVRIRFNEALPKLQKKSATILDLLNEVNDMVGMSLYEPQDALIFRSPGNRINSKTKLEQVLKYNNGYWYLPFAQKFVPGLPRMSQFKLFVLYGIFGKKYQTILKAQRKYDQQFRRELNTLLMRKQGPRRSARLKKVFNELAKFDYGREGPESSSAIVMSNIPQGTTGAETIPLDVRNTVQQSRSLEFFPHT
eukprot:TRINITY_DN8175_c0_g2_i1.p1 TRINITY_DN8175_c0_g2~~TRINITY_DN8175_c0_g2_i1.p1  ORF type:complete len:256 (-),score=21.71 TRINITY_DN8175_c0_g2_i1:435-1202(-)